MEISNATLNGTESSSISDYYDSTHLIHATEPTTKIIKEFEESTWSSETTATTTTTTTTKSFLTSNSTTISSKTTSLLDAITNSVLNSTTKGSFNLRKMTEPLTSTLASLNLKSTSTSPTSQSTEASLLSIQSTLSVTNFLLSTLKASSSTKPSQFGPFVVVNNRNLSMLTPNGSSSFIAIDNQAKEILLVSTAFAAMILCTCLLIFMLWFCCFALFREKKFKANTQMLVKSIKETEMNLRKLGIVIDARKQSCGEKVMIAHGEDLLVRDEEPIDELKSTLKDKKAKRNESNLRMMPIGSGTMNRPVKSTNAKSSENYEMSKRAQLKNEETGNDLNNDSLNFTQPYDMLDSNRSTAQSRRKKMAKEALKKELTQTQSQTENSEKKANEQINEAFVNDEDELASRDYDCVTKRRNEKGEYVSHVPTFNYLKFNKESNVVPRVRSTANLDIQVTTKRANESRTSKNKVHGNQTGSLNRREMPSNTRNSTRHQSSSLTRKVQQTPNSAQRLSREQIEKEFYEYTLQCRKRIKELFSDSSVSSSEHEYTSFNDDEHTAQQQRASNAQPNRRSSSLHKATSKRSMSSPYCSSVGVEQVCRV